MSEAASELIRRERLTTKEATMPATSNSSASRLMVVGEAWGRHEEEAGEPFVGPTGRFLHVIAKTAGLSLRDAFLTNVFNLRPKPTNAIENLAGPRDEGLPGYPPISSGKYIRREFAPELERLEREIRAFAPTMILALGATAVWALLHERSIAKVRGTPVMSRYGVKVFPTYHPAAVLRQQSLRPIIYADFKKAARELSRGPEIHRPEREFWLAPTLRDLPEFESRFLIHAKEIGADIETKSGTITCIGFSADHRAAIVVPFWSYYAADGNYWPTAYQERRAWEWCRHILVSYPLVFQNGLYDINYLWSRMGIPARGARDDTMLMHHALQPEMPKGLGVLGSLYTDEPSWKHMRRREKDETLKKED